jgi:pimeloyl-ACP methyl ester carboxylesterase
MMSKQRRAFRRDAGLKSSAATAFFLAVMLAFAAGVAAQQRGAANSSPMSAVAFTPAPPLPAQAAGEGKTVTVFGQKINYVESGSGPTVVLLHGMGGNMTNWAFNAAALAEKFHVVALDQIGYGRSDKPLINYHVATYVDFLDKFLDELKIERASLVGNSLGGWIAAAYTLKHPNRVERLVLVDAAGFAPPKEFDMGVLVGLNPSTRDGMRQLMQTVVSNKALLANDAVIDAALTQRLTAGDGYTIQSILESVNRREDVLDGKLSAVKQPVLLVWGRDDGLTPLAREGQKFKQEIPQAQLVVFDNCGHVPMIEKPAEFNAAVLKFLTAQ